MYHGKAPCPVAHVGIVIALVNGTETAGAIHSESNGGRMGVPNDRGALESAGGLLQIVSTGTEDVGRAVMDHHTISIEPLSMLLGSDVPVLLHELDKELIEVGLELRILVSEPADELLMVTPKKLDLVLGNLQPTRRESVAEQVVQGVLGLPNVVGEVGMAGFVVAMGVE